MANEIEISDSQSSIPAMDDSSQIRDKFYNRLFVFEKARDRLYSLVDDWAMEAKETEKRRTIRALEVDIDQLIRDGKVKNDEVVIGFRVIDENIKEEQPQYLNYLTRSRRLLVMKDSSNLNVSYPALENFFTEGMRYDNWIKAWQKVVDGGQTHGWDAIEIEHDNSKPFLISLSHIGHENLIFDKKKLEAIEDVEEILRQYDLTPFAFEEMSDKIGFDPEVVQFILTKFKTDDKMQENKDLKVYKRWHKFEGKVWVSWFISKDLDEHMRWLKPPTELYLGDSEVQEGFKEIPIRTQDELGNEIIVPTQVPSIEVVNKQETEYPVKIFIYQENEEAKLKDKKGRVFQDLPKQEAEIALWSLYITGCARAASVTGSIGKNNPLATGKTLQKLDVEIESHAIYDQPVDWHSPEYPSFDVIRAANALNTRNKAEQGSFAAAVLNRKDSRKTAEELKQAESKEVSLGSLQVISFSSLVSEVYISCFRLMKGLLQAGLVEAPQELAAIILQVKLSMAPAGDIDVIKRQEKLNNRFNVWPLIATNPDLSQVFLLDILAELFPEDLPKYLQAIQQGGIKDQIIQSLAGMLGASLIDPKTGQIRAEMADLIPQIKQLEKQLGISIIQERPDESKQLSNK